MLEGILLDLDGVVVDSERLYFLTVRDTFRTFGVEISLDEYIKRWMIEQTCSPGAIKDYGLSVTLEDVRAVRRGLFNEALQRLEMMPDAPDFLARVYGRYPLGLVSSAGREEVQLKLKKFDLVRFFSFVLSADDVSSKKPHKEPYERGCRLLNFSSENVLVVEDNPSGVKSAKDAGCKVVARPCEFTKGMNFSQADRVVQSLYEVNEEMLMRLFQN